VALMLPLLLEQALALVLALALAITMDVFRLPPHAGAPVSIAAASSAGSATRIRDLESMR